MFHDKTKIVCLKTYSLFQAHQQKMSPQHANSMSSTSTKNKGERENMNKDFISCHIYEACFCLISCHIRNKKNFRIKKKIMMYSPITSLTCRIRLKNNHVILVLIVILNITRLNCLFWELQRF